MLHTDVVLDFYPESQTLTDYEQERGKPMPTKTHGKIQSNLNFYLKMNFGKRFDVLSEVTYDVPGKPLTPDISLDEPEPMDLLDDTPREPTAPITAIEIISPSQTIHQLFRKARQFLDFGCKSVWIIQPPTRSIYVFYPNREFITFINHEILKDEITGVEVPLDEIFA